MTQQSLITRLKAVEEALSITQDDVISFANDETNPDVKANLLRDVKRAEAALSDIRELIKEAEGQECVGYFDREDKKFSLVGRVGWEELYTAIVEKP